MKGNVELDYIEKIYNFASFVLVILVFQKKLWYDSICHLMTIDQTFQTTLKKIDPFFFLFLCYLKLLSCTT